MPTPPTTPRPVRRRGWGEFREKNGRRYARRRSWKKIDGEWKKVFGGRVRSIPAMSEKEYKAYVKQREAAKRRRKQRS